MKEMKEILESIDKLHPTLEKSEFFKLLYEKYNEEIYEVFRKKWESGEEIELVQDIKNKIRNKFMDKINKVLRFF